MTTSERAPPLYWFPTSFAQERMWLVEQLNPGTDVYHVSFAWRISGPLDASVLKASVESVVRRHDALRTTFEVVDGAPVQVIGRAVDPFLPTIHLGGETPAEVEIAEHVKAEARRAFDLRRGPLVRARLLVVSGVEHVLLLDIHHIVADGWSVGIFFREVSECYRALLAGEPPELAELVIQYGDFAAWQRDPRHADVYLEQLNYWKAYLRGCPRALPLPTDRPRPAFATHRGGTVPSDVSRELSARVRDVGRRFGSTEFAALAAAFAVLLERYSHASDLCIGYPVSGRNRTETEGLIGLFVNTLVLRTRFDADWTCADLLRDVHESLLEGQARQDLPFQRLVRELEPDRDAARTPLFQVMLALDNTETSTLDLAGLTVTPLRGQPGSAEFDLTLSMRDEMEGLHGAFEYNEDLFDRATVDRMASHYGAVLEGIVSNPRGRVRDLALLSPAARHQILGTWNETATDLGTDTPVHHLFEREAERHADALALLFGRARVTYRELNERANQLAHGLRRAGVRPDDRVALCVNHSVEMVVGVLGILKAGGAYVPLDPESPRAWLADVLKDTGARLLLTQRRFVDELSSDTGPRVVCLDGGGAAFRDRPLTNPDPVVHPLHLAYAIYTSGSTGTPKGVMISHASLLASTLARTRMYSPLGRLLLLSPPWFDSSVAGIFGALLGSGTLVVVDREAARDPREVWTAIQEHGVETVDCIPSLYQLVLDQRPAGSRSSVRQIIVGGEPCPPLLPSRAAARDPDAVMFNEYGPTEVTVWATVHRCDGSEAGRSVPIGRPIANARVYVLDAHLEPVPVGVCGEICVGGPGVARGYLGRPGLTAERFVPDPHGPSGSRIYRTGDVGKYLPDGSIEFVGRSDQQVKVRGSRIELGEVEAALLRCEGVSDAVVAAPEDRVRGRRLVAYVSGTDGATLTGNALRKELERRLPAFMVPSAFVVMKELPRNANGKIDRQSLPPPSRDRETGGGEYVPPRTETEKALARIWADVLSLERIGVHDDFFTLGGDSLSATTVTARIREMSGSGFSLRAFFQHPTIAAIASAIETPDDAGPTFEVAAPSAADVENGSPLLFSQEWLWDRFLHDREVGARYALSIALALEGPLDRSALEASLSEIVRRHECLRTSFRVVNGTSRAFVAPGGPFPLAKVGVPASPERDVPAEIARSVESEVSRPFDLFDGPPIRAVLYRLGAERHVLLVVIHHIVCDGWSLALFERELSALYTAHVGGTGPELAPRTIQDRHIASWQHDRLARGEAAADIAYWKKMLAGLPCLKMPSDKPRPAKYTLRGDVVSFVIDEATTRALDVARRRNGVSEYMVLLAAYIATVYATTGEKDVFVRSPTAYRNATFLENAIGLHTSTIVVRVRADAPFPELLERVRENVTEALTHRDVPGLTLAQHAGPPVSGAYFYRFQLAYNHLSYRSDAPHFSGLSVTPFQHSTPLFAMADINFVTEKRGATLRAALIYYADLFTPAKMQEFARRYCTVLQDGLRALADCG